MGGRAARTQYQYTLQDANLAELERRGRRSVLETLTDAARAQATWRAISRPAGSQLRRRGRPRHAPRASASPRRRWTTRSTTRSASARSRPCSPQLNQYRVVLEVKPELPRQRPTRSTQRLRRARRRRARCRSSPSPGLAGATPLSVNHQGQFPAVTLSFNLAPGVALGQARDGDPARRAADRAARQRPRAASRAPPRRSQSRSASEPLLDPGGALAVYIVLGVLYESYIHPITILSTLPSAGVGALLALLLIQDRAQHHRPHRHHPAHRHREEERDHDDRLRHRGRAGRRASRPREAIHRACLLRFRPIMMTTLAALLGGLPLALGAGVGSELRRRSASPSWAACSSRSC